MAAVRKRANQRLVKDSAERAETLLENWANMPDFVSPSVLKKLDHTNIEITPEEEQVTAAFYRCSAGLIKRFPDVFPQGEEAPSVHWMIIEIRTRLRAAWNAADLRTREWLIFRIRERYGVLQSGQSMLAQALDARTLSDHEIRDAWKRQHEDSFQFQLHPPALTPFERVMYHFQRIADRARRCANPECSSPYFFVRKKGQKYCTLACSEPAELERKRRWWRENRSKSPE